MKWLLSKEYRLRRRLTSVNAKLEALASHMQRHGYHQHNFDRYLELLGKQAALKFEMRA